MALPRRASFTKYVKNLSDPAFHENCIHVGRFTTFHPGQEIKYDEVSCFEEDRIWGTVAAILIFLPGWPIAMKMSTTIAERTKKDYARGLAYLLLLPSMLIFPFLLIFMKLVSLFNPGPAWNEATIMLTILEANWESSQQLLLTLFIIVNRADRRPAWWQIASLIASVVIITMTSIAFHLRKNKMPTKEELKITITLLPLFLSNMVFKIMSLGLSYALLRWWGFVASALLPLLIVPCTLLTAGRKHLGAGNLTHVTGLIMVDRPDLIKTRRESMRNYLFNTIVLVTVHTIVLTGLVFTANNYPDTYVYNLGDILWDIEETSDNINKATTNSTQAPSNFTNMKGIGESPQSFGNAVLHSLFDSYNLSSTALVQNLPLLNGLYICILCKIVLHAVLFFFQVWKPFKEDEAEKKEVDNIY